MQARLFSLVAAAAVVTAATVAMAQQSPTIQTDPAAAKTDYLLEIDGVKGESSERPKSPPPPPPPPPQNAPTAEQGVLSPEMREAALLVPAVQKIREAPAHGRGQNGGVLVLSGSSPPATEAPTATAVSAQPPNPHPEQPVCGYCGADAVAPPPASAAARDVSAQPRNPHPEQPVCGHCGADAVASPPAPAQPERPRRRFSLSIGGVTLSSDGGVNVAVGDVNGDGSGHQRSESSGARTAPPRSAPTRTSSSRPR
jgi:hypothetical protein